MANVGKKDGGQHGQQGQQGQQGQGSQPQRADLVRRDPFMQLARDPFQMLMRDPFQLMREMMVDPFRMFQQLAPYAGRELVWNVGFDIRETDDAFLFKADLPGIRDEDLDITLVGDQLQISGKREHEREEKEEGRVHAYERSYGTFMRTFSLPETADLDNIRSDLKEGVLSIIVPKKAGAKPQRRKIQIGGGSKA